MKRSNRFIRLSAVLLGIALSMQIARAGEPATLPADAKTGELDLTFTQRSPLSARKEIARRLAMKDAAIGEDYDLATRPFKLYVPTAYNPAVPHGVFVYLGYKDTVQAPTLWEPVLDKAHLIFITPECHHGDQYPNGVPVWQMMGLAFDAIENLKHLYNVDPRRLYLMSFHDSSLQMAFAASDVFTGMLCAQDDAYFRKITLRGFQPMLPRSSPPPGALLQEAKRRPIVMLDANFDPNVSTRITFDAMKSDGFNVMAQVSDTEDFHYPNLKPEWFEGTVLPLLDKAALSAPEPRVAVAAASAVSKGGAAPLTRPASAGSPAVATANPEADRMLRMARLYIQNGQPNLARPKLETILSAYPKDPSAAEAKSLLGQLPEPAEK